MNVPDRLYAGDTLEFTTTVADYPPSDGWTLRYRFVPRFASPSQAPIEFDAAAAGDDYTVLQGPDTTAGWLPGAYGWFRWVYKSGARVTLDDLDSRGQLEILQNPATAVQGFDNRTSAQRALDDLKAAFAAASERARTQGSAGLPVEYRIGDRMVKYDNLDVALAGLIKAINRAELDVAREQNEARVARGLKTNRLIGTRF
jgi:hypothetical protein